MRDSIAEGIDRDARTSETIILHGEPHGCI